MKSKERKGILSRLMLSSVLIAAAGIATAFSWLMIFRAMKSLTSILFFQGCFASLCTFVAITGILLLIRGLGIIRAEFTGVLIGLVGLCIGFIMTIFVVFPVSYDRSVSIFLLARVAASGKEGVRAADLERQLIERYVVENRAVERRIREQLETGTIEANGTDRFALTSWGRKVLCINPTLEYLFGYQNADLAGICTASDKDRLS
jgi:hypothetical protein